MCSMLANFVASDHMIKVLLLRPLFGLLRLWVRETDNPSLPRVTCPRSLGSRGEMS